MIRVIIDTDANNEVDDQHALAYALLNRDIYDVLAISAHRTTSGGSLENHVKEAQRITALCDRNDVPVLRGASGDFETVCPTLDTPDFDGAAAVHKIIECAGKPLVIIALGKLTTIALALKKAPQIAPSLRILWLGSNYPKPGEYNLVEDVSALNSLLNTDVCFEVAVVRYHEETGTSAVRASIDEIRKTMPGLGPQVSPVIGRTGNPHTCFGDYSVDLFNHIELDCGTRSLYDLAATALIKNPAWAVSREIPAPCYQNDTWIERPGHSRRIVLRENFDASGIITDLFDTMRRSTP